MTKRKAKIKTGFVYLARVDSATNWYKYGMTEKQLPSARMPQIQSATGHKMKLISSFKSANPRADEYAIKMIMMDLSTCDFGEFFESELNEISIIGIFNKYGACCAKEIARRIERKEKAYQMVQA